MITGDARRNVAFYADVLGLRFVKKTVNFDAPRAYHLIYFRQPRGLLFEIATNSPGFAVDEDPEHLGEQLRLPRQHEHLRPQLEQILAPLANQRAERVESGS